MGDFMELYYYSRPLVGLSKSDKINSAIRHAALVVKDELGQLFMLELHKGKSKKNVFNVISLSEIKARAVFGKHRTGKACLYKIASSSKSVGHWRLR